MSYCIDTSALLEAWSRRYPVDIFPRLWENFESLVVRGELIAPEEVREEIKVKEDGLTAWTKRNPTLFYALDKELMLETRRLLRSFPKLVGAGNGRNRADPFVIGLAIIKGSTVVCNEKISGNPEKPKMPDVCDANGVRCITILDLIREQNWSF